MDNASNPLVPTAGDFVFGSLGFALSLAVVILLVWALISLAGFKDITSLQRLAWVLIILFAPVAGPVAWLVLGRPLMHLLNREQETPRHIGADTEAGTR